MSIKVIKKKERKAIPYDGSTMEKALAWSAVSSSGTTGTLSGMTYDSSSYRYIAWIAVQLIATQEYTSSFGGWDSGVELYDAEGTKLAYSQFGWDEDTGDELDNPLTYTPSTAGTYYLKFYVEYYDSEYPPEVSFSPRPADPDRPLYLPWETSEGLDAGHLPVKYNTAEEAGIRFDGTPIVGLDAISRALRKFWMSFSLQDWSYLRIRDALAEDAITMNRYHDSDDGLVFGNENGKLVLQANQGSGSSNGISFKTDAEILSMVVRFKLPVVGPYSNNDRRELMFISCDCLGISVDFCPSGTSVLPTGVTPPNYNWSEMINTSAAKGFIRINEILKKRVLYYYMDGDTPHYSWTTDQEHDWYQYSGPDEGLFCFEPSQEQYFGANEWHTIAATYRPKSGGLDKRSGTLYGGQIEAYMDGSHILTYTGGDNEQMGGINLYDCTPGYIWLAVHPAGGGQNYSPVTIDMQSLKFYTRDLSSRELEEASRYQ